MNAFKVQWLTQDESLWESDWLLHLMQDVTDHIKVEFCPEAIQTDTNTVLICSHAVPYRQVLNELRQKGKQYVIVLLSDENLRDLCEWVHDPNCRGLLRNYINPYMLKHPKVHFFGLGYKRGFSKNLKNSQERLLTWSFAGTLHNNRRQVIEQFKVFNPYQIHECSGFNAADGLQTKEYAELLENSKYAIVPEGQDSIDSFRLYEALEAGCVPVTVCNSQRFKILPSYWNGIFDTTDTLPFVMEESWEKVAELLSKESENSLQVRQQKCAKLWENSKQRWKTTFKLICSALA